MQTQTLALLGGSPAVTIQKKFPWPMIPEADIKAVEELLRSGQTSDTGYGEHIRRLEEEWARYLGVPYALSRVNGTAALHSACYAVGLGPGDEAIVQSYTWVATAGCILAAGAVPVFAEIDPRTYTLDPQDVASRVTPRTKAIVAVHLWGHATEMDDIMAVAAKHGLAVVEDAAHAHGGTYRGRKIGTIGEAGCFSFQATKALPAGEGGIMVTGNQECFERALLLSQSPMRLNIHLQMEKHRRFKETGFGGFKYRMNPINAVIALGQLKQFEQWNAIRQKNLDHLAKVLSGVPGIRPPYTAPHVTRGGYYGFPVLYCPEELEGLPMDVFVKALNAEGVPLERERYPLLHLSPMYREQNPPGGGWPWSFSEHTRSVVYRPGDLPVTEDLYARMLALPAWDRALPCEDLFDQYGEAFQKVVSNVGRLMDRSRG